MHRIIASSHALLLCGVALVLGLCAGPALADQTYDDPAADGNGAPDVVSASVANDNLERLTFRIRFAEPGQLTAETKVWLMIDLDRRGATGDRDGQEREILYDGEEDAYGFYAWNGKTMAQSRAGSLRMLVRDQEIEISIDRLDLGAGQSFDFWVYADRYTADAVTATDAAPDGSAVWTYTLEAKPLKLRAQAPSGSPRFPIAGKRFELVMFVFRDVDGRRIASGTVQCVVRVGGKPIAARASLSAGIPTCKLTVPAGSQGKRVTGSIGVATPGGRVSRTFSFRVL